MKPSAQFIAKEISLSRKDQRLGKRRVWTMTNLRGVGFVVSAPYGGAKRTRSASSTTTRGRGFRFFSHMPRLLGYLVRILARVEHVRQLALVAEHDNRNGSEIVGFCAREVRSAPATGFR